MRGLLQGDGLGRMGVRSSVPGEDGCGGGNTGKKIPTGTRLRLWNAKRLLTSYKTSVSTVGFQGPLRKVFPLLPPATVSHGPKPPGKFSPRPSSSRCLTASCIKWGSRLSRTYL